MTKPTRTRDCMHSNPITVTANENLASAAKKIIDERLTGLTVVDEDGAVVGVISELDCLRGALSAIYNEDDPESVLVHEVMSTDINTCGPDDGIIEVAQQMLETQQRRRPVVENGKLVGQVSSKTVLWALMENTRRNR